MLMQRPASMIATFLALWFAVAMVTTCGAMLESGLRDHGTTARYAAAPVVVATTDLRLTEGSGDDRDTESEPLVSPGRLDASLARRVAAAPGVRAAVSDVAVPGQLISGRPPLPVQVHPWSAARLAPFTVRAGSAPTTGGQVVLDQETATRTGARPGRAVRLDLASGVRTFTVAGIAATTGAAPANPTVFVDDATAATLSGNATEVIGVLADRGVATPALAAAVRRALPHIPSPSGAYPQVFVGSGRGSVGSPDVDNGREFVISLSSVFGGSTLLIAVLVIAGTVGLSVKQRRRDIALLRAVAATPRQIRRMVVREAAALSLVAGATGIWPGLAGAQWLRDQFVSRGMAPDTFRAHLSWLPPLVAVSSAMLVAVVAAWVASRRASRIRPTEALAESTVERRSLGVVRTVLGLIGLAGGITLCRVSASATGDGAAGISVGTVFTFVVAVALLSPLLIRAAAATLGRALHLAGVTGRLAAANTGTSARQVSAVVSALVLAVALGGSLWFVQTSEEHIASRESQAGLTARLVVTPPASGLPPAVAAAVRRTDGVTAATGIVHSTLFSPQSGISDYSAQGVDATGLRQTMDLGVTSGSIGGLRGNTLAVDTLTAQALHLRVGDRFHGWFGDGAVANLRVVAVYRRGLGFAQLTVPRDVLMPHAGSTLDAVLVATAAADTSRVAAAVRSELGRLSPGSSLVARGAYQTGLDKDLAENAWGNQVIIGVLLVYVVIGSVNTLVMYALGRRREFAVLRLAGTTRRQVARMVGLEQVLLLGLALAVGGAIAAATLIPMVKGITGSAIPYIPPAGWVAVIGGVVVLGVVATAVPVRRVLRMHPVDAIGLRE